MASRGKLDAATLAMFNSLPQTLFLENAVPAADAIVNLGNTNKLAAMGIFENLIAVLKPVLEGLKKQIESHELFENKETKEGISPFLDILNATFKQVDGLVADAKTPKGAANFISVGPGEGGTRKSQKGGATCFDKEFAKLKISSDAFQRLKTQSLAEPGNTNLIAALMFTETQLRQQAETICNKDSVALAIYKEVKLLGGKVPAVPAAALGGAGVITYASSLLPGAAGKMLGGVAYVGGAALGGFVYPVVSGGVAAYNGFVKAVRYVPGTGALSPINFPTGLDPISIGETFSSGITAMQEFLSKSGGNEIGFFFLILLFLVLFFFFVVCGIGLQKVSQLKGVSVTPVSFSLDLGAAQPLALAAPPAAAGPALMNRSEQQLRLNQQAADALGRLLTGSADRPAAAPAPASLLTAGNAAARNARAPAADANAAAEARRLAAAAAPAAANARVLAELGELDGGARRRRRTRRSPRRHSRPRRKNTRKH